MGERPMERRPGWRDIGDGPAKLVLGFDGRCTRCTGLANRIRRCVGGRLEVGDLLSARARRWRERALGGDAPLVPTLFEVRGRQVRAWVGIEMGLVLAHRLGAADGLRVLRALGDTRGTEGDPADSVLAPGRLRLAGVPLAETARGAALAVGALRAGTGVETAPGCSPSQRREARRIVRESEEYLALAEVLDSTLDLRRARFVAAGDGDEVGVVATSAGDGILAFAAFLVDLRRGALDAYRHTTVTSTGGTYVVAGHRGGEAGETLVIGDDYVVLPDGAWVTPEEFRGLARAWEPARREGETDVVYGDARRSSCLQGSYDFCRRLAEAYRESWVGIPRLGSIGVAACDHLARRWGDEAGCRAWARTRCYLGVGGLWPEK
jgi:hypothetical protein